MRTVYHQGELAVQERAGVRGVAARVAGSIRPAIPPVARSFLEERRVLVVATIDAKRRPWASILTGAPGLARAVDDHTIRVDASPVPGDPLAANLSSPGFIGLIAPDLATRRRLRLNGTFELDAGGGVLIRADEVYSNCPKYIQRREGERETVARPRASARRAAALDDAQRDWIARADTFFIATWHPEAGADASHRGGMPGFVRVEGDRVIWPDYPGNAMFNTLGNIEAYPRAGLVFPDFEAGATLQLTGRAGIDWDEERARSFPRAERLVELAVEEVVEIQGALPLALRLRDYSPVNPPAPPRSERIPHRKT
jgi:uncharacterized protein